MAAPKLVAVEVPSEMEICTPERMSNMLSVTTEALALHGAADQRTHIAEQTAHARSQLTSCIVVDDDGRLPCSSRQPRAGPFAA